MLTSFKPIQRRERDLEDIGDDFSSGWASPLTKRGAQAGAGGMDRPWHPPSLVTLDLSGYRV